MKMIICKQQKRQVLRENCKYYNSLI